MGREGVYLEDHEDQLSIQGEGEDISYNQSQYSHKKFKDSSYKYDRRTVGAHSDEVYQNGSYLGKHCKKGKKTLKMILILLTHIWHNWISFEL